MTCPVDLKVKNLFNRPRLDENQIGNKKETYFQQTSDGKSLLREVMSDIIPSSITEGKKKGFSSPDASWFKNESVEYLKKRIILGNSDIYRYINRNLCSEIVFKHIDGIENRRLFIWSLLSFDSNLKIDK
jgi:asparagine synthase (glutamine-hydrolysing)